MSSPRPVIGWTAMAVSTAIIAALAGVPFLVATVVRQQRVSVAVAETAEIAAALRADGAVGRADVLVSGGNVPRFADGAAWATRAAAPMAALRPGAAVAGAAGDPWRNHYLVNAGARGAIWVLSAGPNGIIETPFDAQEPDGDDIGARVR